MKRFWRVLAATIGTIVMTGCTTLYDRIGASHVTRVVEGRVVEVRLHKASNEVRVGDTVTTAVAANHVGNIPVMRGLLVLDVLSLLTESEKSTEDFYTILDEKTQEKVKISSESLYRTKVKGAKEGDLLRAINTKAGRWTVYNLTKYPELEEMTR